MAEYYNNQQEEGVEKVDGGMFDQFAKKKEDDVISSEFEDKVMVSDQPQENSSNDDEEEYFEDEEQKSKLAEEAGIGGEGEYDEQDKADVDTRVPVENIRDEEEGDLEKKLPGGDDDLVVGDDVECPPPTPAAEVAVEEADQPDKKGLLDKIKDKIPGF